MHDVSPSAFYRAPIVHWVKATCQSLSIRTMSDSTTKDQRITPCVSNGSLGDDGHVGDDVIPSCDPVRSAGGDVMTSYDPAQSAGDRVVAALQHRLAAPRHALTAPRLRLTAPRHPLTIPGPFAPSIAPSIAPSRPAPGFHPNTCQRRHGGNHDVHAGE